MSCVVDLSAGVFAEDLSVGTSGRACAVDLPVGVSAEARHVGTRAEDFPVDIGGIACVCYLLVEYGAKKLSVGACS